MTRCSREEARGSNLRAEQAPFRAVVGFALTYRPHRVILDDAVWPDGWTSNNQRAEQAAFRAGFALACRPHRVILDDAVWPDGWTRLQPASRAAIKR